MKKIYYILIVGALCSALFFSTTGYAVQNEIDPRHRALAVEFLQVTKQHEALDATIKGQVDHILTVNPGADRQELTTRFQNIMGWEVLAPTATELVIRRFSPEELEGINAFYKTPVGSNYASKSVILAADMSNLISLRIRQAVPQ